MESQASEVSRSESEGAPTTNALRSDSWRSARSCSANDHAVCLTSLNVGRVAGRTWLNVSRVAGYVSRVAGSTVSRLRAVAYALPLSVAHALRVNVGRFLAWSPGQCRSILGDVGRFLAWSILLVSNTSANETISDRGCAGDRGWADVYWDWGGFGLHSSWTFDNTATGGNEAMALYVR